jgi:large subunit ribosomal protein L32
MAVPKRRQSNHRTGNRRAHDHKKPRQLTFCPSCGFATPTHVVCSNCGYYQGRIVVDMKATAKS